MYIKFLKLFTSVLSLLSVSMYLPQNVQAATAAFGHTSVGSLPDTGDSHYINAWQFTTSATQSGPVLSMSVYVSGPVSAAPSNQFQVALYTDAGGAPGSLITASATSTIVQEAWNTVPLQASLAPNTSYWLAYNTNGRASSDNNVPLAVSGSLTHAWTAHTFGSWPTTFGGARPSKHDHGSIYVTYSPAGMVEESLAPSPGEMVEESLAPVPQDNPPAVAGTGQLLREGDLAYLGAFLLPQWTSDTSSFSYGGTALAYHAARNSLFIVGHDWYQRTAEVAIPPLVQSTNLSALQRASLLQPFVDATNGTINQTGGSTNKIGGQLVYQDRLYGTAYIYYDGSGSQKVSHWGRPSTSLASGTADGLYQVGTSGAGFVSGYMTLLPPAWQSTFGGPALTGNCCLSIITRTSYGPAAFVFDPAALGRQQPVPAIPLVYYPASQPTLGKWEDSWNPSRGVLFNGTTVIRAVVFPHGSGSVLFVGTQGVGTFCYGSGGASGECYDPDNTSKGGHAYPYAAMVWAYDANELVAVKNGQKQPWEVKPYATWPLHFPFGPARIGGAAYDPATGRIYVSQQYGNGADPVIHVFHAP